MSTTTYSSLPFASWPRPLPPVTLLTNGEAWKPTTPLLLWQRHLPLANPIKTTLTPLTLPHDGDPGCVCLMFTI